MKKNKLSKADAKRIAQINAQIEARRKTLSPTQRAAWERKQTAIAFITKVARWLESGKFGVPTKRSQDVARRAAVELLGFAVGELEEIRFL
jgi:hypothetical protein